MSGWTYDVTVSKVKRKSKVIRVRAFSEEEATVFAKKVADMYEWETSTQGLEYEARELHDE